MNQGKITNLLLWTALAIFLFGSGYKLGEYRTSQKTRQRPFYNILNAPSEKTQQKDKNIDFNLFWDTWNKVEQKYIDKEKLDPQKMFYGALKGLVASLEDPYTFFLTPEENKQSKDDLEGKFEGIGAQLGLKNNRIVIIAPLKSSPAEKAGVRAGDYVVKVNGQSTKNWSLPQAVSKIRGKKGTKVKLTLLRGNKEFDVEITRDQIIVDSVELSFEKRKDCKRDCDQVAYIKLNQFGENTNEEWDQVADKVEESWNNKSVKGAVVDVRDNPGGFLESSVYVASEFLPFDRLIVKQETTDAGTREYHVARRGKLTDIPLVVLINKGSASASEIFAGALRDHKRTSLVGEKTFGKGSVQEAIDLKGGAGLHVTIAKWILPQGAWINGKGIEPDMKVENKLPEGNTLTREEDAQLEKAVAEVLE
ncbi:S41 family peptidase [Candidatus Roizmanbacteria bacterium]|nr:S41 family peptidase [Candidatus Roizmanbacteria bacterium]